MARFGEPKELIGAAIFLASSNARYEEIAQGRFPKPVKIGRRASAWLMSEVEAWLDGKLSTRNTGIQR
jgi:prophage regulatory protein